MSAGTTVRVAAVSAQGPTAPAFRVRTRVPAPALARMGVRLEHLPLFDPGEDAGFHAGGPWSRARILLGARRRLRERLKRAPDRFDAVFVQRQVDVLPTLGLERRAAACDRLVLDVDDAIWLDASPAAGGHPLARLKRTRRKLRWLAARADHVVAGNAMLADWLSSYARRVTVVPSLVEPAAIPVREHRPGAHVVLGWIGSASTARYLESVGEELERAATLAPELDLELAIVGRGPLRLRGVEVRAEPWSKATERALLARLDVGLMPLPDNPWTRGKCAYKALQYMAAGVPVLTPDVGISAQVVGNGEAGLVVPDGSWAEAITNLARDPALRARLGEEGRRRVERDYSVGRWAPTLAAILRGY